MITIVLLFYTALYMPYKIAFLEDVKFTTSYYVDMIVDVLFGLDIIITFVSAYECIDGSI